MKNKKNINPALYDAFISRMVNVAECQNTKRALILKQQIFVAILASLYILDV